MDGAWCVSYVSNYLVGCTSSDDFPVTDGAVQKQHGGKGDAFVVKLMPVLGQQP